MHLSSQLIRNSSNCMVGHSSNLVGRIMQNRVQPVVILHYSMFKNVKLCGLDHHLNPAFFTVALQDKRWNVASADDLFAPPVSGTWAEMLPNCSGSDWEKRTLSIQTKVFPLKPHKNNRVWCVGRSPKGMWLGASSHFPQNFFLLRLE